MTANELATSIATKVTNDSISRSQADYLWSLAQTSGQAEVAGQRIARGETSNGQKWVLSFYKGVGYFKVQ